MTFSGSNILVQQKVAKLVTSPSEGNGNGRLDEKTKDSTKCLDDCKTAGDETSKVSPSSDSIHQSNGTGVELHTP